jgi:hypothetical protein
MNYETDSIYIAIKNNPLRLESIFQGLFIVARRALGFNTRGSSFPFITHEFSSTHRAYENQLERARKIGQYLTPVVVPKGMCRQDHVMGVTISSVNSDCPPAVFKACWDEMTELLEIPASEIGDMKKAFVAQDLLIALFADYYADMLTFANCHGRYDRNWQGMALELKKFTFKHRPLASLVA